MRIAQPVAYIFPERSAQEKSSKFSTFNHMPGDHGAMQRLEAA